MNESQIMMWAGNESYCSGLKLLHVDVQVLSVVRAVRCVMLRCIQLLWLKDARHVFA